MNILFILKSLDLGGLEVVTATLANKFLKEGHCVYIYAFERRTGKLLTLLGKEVNVVIAGYYRVSDDNILLLSNYLKENEIKVVVNQWGLPLIPIRTLCKAKRGMNIKVISVYHSDPFINGRLYGVGMEMLKSRNIINKAYLHVKLFFFRCITGYSMRFNYKHSDLYEVLSPTYIPHFKKFTMMHKTPKLLSLPNPVTVDANGFEYNIDNKLCEIIYIGRIVYSPKRPDRVIDVWHRLERGFPEWQLTIVGDGTELNVLKDMVRKRKMRHVSFEGFQQPKPYYERASILLLTSDFEGFPLVLTECMSFGVVPVVYGSFSAVYDIIENGKNGIIIPQTSFGFDATLMVESLQALMENKTLMDKMAQHAIEKSKQFSIDRIYQEWTKIIQ